MRLTTASGLWLCGTLLLSDFKAREDDVVAFRVVEFRVVEYSENDSSDATVGPLVAPSGPPRYVCTHMR